MNRYKSRNALLAFGYIRKQSKLVNVSRPIPTDLMGLCYRKIEWAYDVPIYNQKYYDCAYFKIGDQFDMHGFALLCKDFAVRRDKIFQSKMRPDRLGNSRSRTITQYGYFETGFENVVEDDYYRKLFRECFLYTDNEENKDLILNIDLRNYVGARETPFVLYEYGYGINKRMIYRLYLLMRLARKHIAIGCVQQPRWNAPWNKFWAEHINLVDYDIVSNNKNKIETNFNANKLNNSTPNNKKRSVRDFEENNNNNNNNNKIRKIDNNSNINARMKIESKSLEQEQESIDLGCSLFINGFRRPLNTKKVELELLKYGTFKHFKMNAIKSHCYVIFNNNKNATKCKLGMNGMYFPINIPQMHAGKLNVKNVELIEAMTFIMEGKNNKPIIKQSKPKPKPKPKSKSPGEIFKMTKCKPYIFYESVNENNEQKNKESLIKLIENEKKIYNSYIKQREKQIQQLIQKQKIQKIQKIEQERHEKERHEKDMNRNHGNVDRFRDRRGGHRGGHSRHNHGNMDRFRRPRGGGGGYRGGRGGHDRRTYYNNNYDNRRRRNDYRNRRDYRNRDRNRDRNRNRNRRTFREDSDSSSDDVHSSSSSNSSDSYDKSSDSNSDKSKKNTATTTTTISTLDNNIKDNIKETSIHPERINRIES